MSKLTFIIQPRQSGKTTLALYEYVKNPNTTVFVSTNTTNAKILCEKVRGNYDNFISSKQINHLKGRKNIETIILDEYLFYTNKKEIYETLFPLSVKEVIILTSAKYQYDYNLFNIIKSNKFNLYKGLVEDLYLNYLNNLDLLSKKQKKLNKEQKFKFDELYYNFITDKNINLIDDLVIKPYNKNIKDILGDEYYEIGHENKWHDQIITFNKSYWLGPTHGKSPKI